MSGWADFVAGHIDGFEAIIIFAGDFQTFISIGGAADTRRNWVGINSGEGAGRGF